MRTICKACGAPLHSDKCDYCGAIYKENRRTPQPSTNDINYDIPQSNLGDIEEASQSNINKIAINTSVGVFSIINSIFLIVYNILLFRVLDTPIATDTEYLMIGLLFIAALLLMIVALILYIISLIRSRKHNIPITGHILGIVGVAITLLTLTFFSFISIILFFLAAIFILKHKNVQPPTAPY